MDFILDEIAMNNYGERQAAEREANQEILNHLLTLPLVSVKGESVMTPEERLLFDALSKHEEHKLLSKPMLLSRTYSLLLWSRCWGIRLLTEELREKIVDIYLEHSVGTVEQDLQRMYTLQKMIFVRPDPYIGYMPYSLHFYTNNHISLMEASASGWKGYHGYTGAERLDLSQVKHPQEFSWLHKWDLLEVVYGQDQKLLLEGAAWLMQELALTKKLLGDGGLAF